MSEIEALFDKAELSFTAAGRLLEDGDADFAASRAYYGYFYVAESLLLSKGLSFSSHGQVIAQYGLHFARSGLLEPRFHQLLEPRFHQLLHRAFSPRQLAGYSVDPNLEPQTIRELIEEGRVFLGDAQSYVSGRSSGEHS